MITEDAPSPAFRRYGNHRNKTVRGFERANWKLALREKEEESNKYFHGEKVSYCTGVGHFKAYGPGVYFFFLFIKMLMWLFFALTMIVILPMIYNFVDGSSFSDSIGSFKVVITKFMIGNHKSSTDNS